MPRALSARTSSTAARVHAIANINNEHDDLLRLEAMAGEQHRPPYYKKKDLVEVNAIEQFSELARSAYMMEVSYFLRQALRHRREGDQATKRQRASFFRDVMEEFVVSEAPFCLHFLSASTNYDLYNHYMALPFELTTPTVGGKHVTDDWYEMTEEHTLPKVFDAAILEALDHAYTVFNQLGLPTACISVLKLQLIES